MIELVFKKTQILTSINLLKTKLTILMDITTYDKQIGKKYYIQQQLSYSIILVVKNFKCASSVLFTPLLSYLKTLGIFSRRIYYSFYYSYLLFFIIICLFWQSYHYHPVDKWNYTCTYTTTRFLLFFTTY